MVLWRTEPVQIFTSVLYNINGINVKMIKVRNRCAPLRAITNGKNGTKAQEQTCYCFLLQDTKTVQVVTHVPILNPYFSNNIFFLTVKKL